MIYKNHRTSIKTNMRLAHFCMLGSANASAGCLVCMASNLTSQCLYWHRQISWLSGLGPSNKQSRRCEVSSRLGWIIVSSSYVYVDPSASSSARRRNAVCLPARSPIKPPSPSSHSPRINQQQRYGSKRTKPTNSPPSQAARSPNPTAGAD
jgi:hypothetical protein